MTPYAPGHKLEWKCESVRFVYTLALIGYAAASRINLSSKEKLGGRRSA